MHKIKISILAFLASLNLNSNDKLDLFQIPLVQIVLGIVQIRFYQRLFFCKENKSMGEKYSIVCANSKIKKLVILTR